MSNETSSSNTEALITDLTALTIFLLPTAIPFILWERSVRKFRRENNLSINGNIEAELEQMERDSRVAKVSTAELKTA